MKRLVLVVPCFLLMLVASKGPCQSPWSIPYDPNTMFYPVSVEQAVETVRDWAGDPELQLYLDGIHLFTSAHDHTYLFFTEGSVHYYQVDCHNGEVVRWVDQANFYEEANGGTLLPIAHLNSIILQFLQEKYPGFASKNMQPFAGPGYGRGSQVLVKHQYGGLAYSYYETLPGNVSHLGNRAGVTLNRFTGQISGYWAGHSPPPTISIVPIIDAAEAEQIAMDYSGTRAILLHSAEWCNGYEEEDEFLTNSQLASIFDNEGLNWYEEGTEFWANPQSAFILDNLGLIVDTDNLVQRLVWDLYVYFHAMENYTIEDYLNELEEGTDTGEKLHIRLDAHTGEVYWCGDGRLFISSREKKTVVQKAKARKPDPSALKSYEKGSLRIDGAGWSDLMYAPLVLGDVGYLYAKYLPVLYGGTISWDSGVVNMEAAGRKVRLYPRTGLMEVDGKEIRLKNPPMLIAGRTYVPYEAIEHICGAKAKWNVKQKRLSITSGDAPLKPQFRRMKK